jgi:hypothetical protein
MDLISYSKLVLLSQCNLTGRSENQIQLHATYFNIRKSDQILQTVRNLIALFLKNSSASTCTTNGRLDELIGKENVACLTIRLHAQCINALLERASKRISGSLSVGILDILLDRSLNTFEEFFEFKFLKLL